jgi:hypothetical protein
MLCPCSRHRFRPFRSPLAARHALDWRRRRRRLRCGAPVWQTPTCGCQFGPICTCHFTSVCACYKLKFTPQLPTSDAPPKRGRYVQQRVLSCLLHRASQVGPQFAPLLSEVEIDANAALSLVTPPSWFPVLEGSTMPPSPCPEKRPVKVLA